MIRRTVFVLAAVAAVLPACKKKDAPAPAPVAAGVDDAAKALASIVASCASSFGEVQARRAGQGDWQPVATGSVFRSGDVVRTGAGAFARVEFLQGGGIEIEENATVVIDLAASKPADGAAPAAAPESRVSVEAGVVRGFLPAPAEGGEALGLVIRGAGGEETHLAAAPGEKPVSFRLTRGDGGTEVAVMKGELRLTGKAGDEKVVKHGQAVDVSAAGVGQLAELLEFPPSVEPGVDARFRWSPDLAIRIAWKPVAGATGYRVQIARDLAFQALERGAEVQGTDETFTPRGEGVYTWRVATRDANGRFGEYGFARRIYCEKEQPRDLLVGPTDGAVVRFLDKPGPVAFTWQSAGDAHSYRVVVAKGRDLLADPVVSRSTPEQRVEIADLVPGEYLWGVYVDDRKVPEPIFVRPRVLVVQKATKPKVKVPRSVGEWGN
ncbi:MAG TPA: hypothetical protein VIW03_06065 [Anaeromyxobacter sp.]